MKALVFGVLTLISVVTCQPELLSPVVIKERAAIFDIKRAWFEQIDSAYFNVYQTMEKMLIKFLAPYVPICNNIMIATGNLQASLQTVDASGQAVDQTPSGLATIIDGVNYSCVSFNAVELANMMIVFPPSGASSPLTNGLDDAIETALSDVISYVILVNPTPKSDSCAINILTNFSPIFKPVVDNILSSADKVIGIIPQIYTNLTTLFAQNKPILTTLINKFNACNNIKSDASRLACAQKLDTYYTGNNYGNWTAVSEAFSKPPEIYPTEVYPLFGLGGILPFRPDVFQITPAMQAQIDALKTIC